MHRTSFVTQRLTTLPPLRMSKDRVETKAQEDSLRKKKLIML